MSLVWTTKPPTEPGFYWVRTISPGKIKPTVAKFRCSTVSPDGPLVFERPGLDHTDLISEHVGPWGLEFAGPVPKPTEEAG